MNYSAAPQAKIWRYFLPWQWFSFKKFISQPAPQARKVWIHYGTGQRIFVSINLSVSVPGSVLGSSKIVIGSGSNPTVPVPVPVLGSFKKFYRFRFQFHGTGSGSRFGTGNRPTLVWLHSHFRTEPKNEKPSVKIHVNSWSKVSLVMISNLSTNRWKDFDQLFLCCITL